MKKNGNARKLTMIAVVLILIGAVLFTVALASNGWKLSSSYVTRTVEITDEFSSVSFDTETEDIIFAPSADGKCTLEFYEKEGIDHTALVSEGTLKIASNDLRNWYKRAFLNFSSQKITVYLPEGEYKALTIDESTGDIAVPSGFSFESVDIDISTGDVAFASPVTGSVSIETSTGDIRVSSPRAKDVRLSVSTGSINVSGLSCEGNVSINVSTGKTYLSDVSCLNLTTDGSTGSITLKNVIASETITVERSTGDVTFDMCDAAELLVETDTGDVTGTLLSDKVFIAKTDTGRVDVPETLSGGKCKITSDTGDISIRIK